MHNVIYFMTDGMFTLTREGAEINFLCFRFQTPLHDAAGQGKGDIAEILLRSGANINEKNVRNTSVGERGRGREKEQRQRGEGRISPSLSPSPSLPSSLSLSPPLSLLPSLPLSLLSLSLSLSL